MKRNGVDRTEARAGGTGGLRPDHEHPATVRCLPGPRPASGRAGEAQCGFLLLRFPRPASKGELLFLCTPHTPLPGAEGPCWRWLDARSLARPPACRAESLPRSLPEALQRLVFRERH